MSKIKDKTTRSNKLSIYLLKHGIKSADAIANTTAIKTKEISENKRIIYSDSYRSKPSFVEAFFHDGDINIFSSSVKAVLVVENVGTEKRTFVVTFGNGRHLINQDALERRFGLKTAINLIDPDSIKQFAKTKLESNARRTVEQVSRAASVSEFGIDIAQDFVNGIAGQTSEKYIKIFGKSVKGSDSLVVRGRYDVDSIEELLEETLTAYERGGLSRKIPVD